MDLRTMNALRAFSKGLWMSLRRRTALWAAVAFSISSGLGGSAERSHADESELPAASAVHIDRDPKQSWPGYGIYLGHGLVITASHVVGQAALTKPSVVVDGTAFPAKAVKEGSLETIDLTLLSMDPSVIPARLSEVSLSLCEGAMEEGAEVVVVTPEAMTRTRIVSPVFGPWWIRLRFRTLVVDVPGTGNSGSGVFDPDRGCLLGIISRRIDFAASDQQPAWSAKYFVPASSIRAFIPADLRW